MSTSIDTPPDEPQVLGDFVPAATVAAEEPPECIVENAVYRGGITVLVGETGASKTFVVTGLGASVATGYRWHGRDVKRGSVAYVGYEADALPRRLQALQGQGHDLEGLYVLRASDPISPNAQRDGAEIPSMGEEILVDRLRRLSQHLMADDRPPILLLIIETVRASLVGSEDNSSDVSAYLRAVRRILAAVPEAGAVLTHHAGWQDSDTKRKRERGSSAFRGNVEVTLYLEVKDDSDSTAVRLDLRTLKSRDAERRAPLRLIRKRVDLLGVDKFGQPLTSCIIERDPMSYEEREAAAEAVKAEQLEAEHAAIDEEVLSVIREHAPTNQEMIRALLGYSRPKAQAAVARLLRSRRIAKAGHRDPFAAIEEGQNSA